MTDAQIEWERCRGWIEEALRYSDGTHSIEDIEAAISRADMIFMPGEHCALVLEVIQHPKQRWMNVFLGGGETGKCVREYVRRMDASVMAVAKALGCEKVTHFTRLNIGPIWARLGYRHQWSVMVKDV